MNNPTTDALLCAPWQRKNNGGLEYLIDAQGRTVCLRVAGGQHHEEIMRLLESLPALLTACEAARNALANCRIDHAIEHPGETEAMLASAIARATQPENLPTP